MNSNPKICSRLSYMVALNRHAGYSALTTLMCHHFRFLFQYYSATHSSDISHCQLSWDIGFRCAAQSLIGWLPFINVQLIQCNFRLHIHTSTRIWSADWRGSLFVIVSSQSTLMIQRRRDLLKAWSFRISVVEYRENNSAKKFQIDVGAKIAAFPDFLDKRAKMI